MMGFIVVIDLLGPLESNIKCNFEDVMVLH